MDDLIIAAIRRRLKTKFTDMDTFSPPILTPGDPTEIERDEKRLGFALPPLLKRIYSEISNGGFGPGYGLIGLTSGVPDDTGKTGPDIYRLLRSADPVDVNLNWPFGLLPICNWGCAIVSCADCADPGFRMRIFDPNAHDGDDGDDWSDSFFEESPSFETWIGAWSSGVDLWALMYGEAGHISQILSARRSIL
jgi:hypothetical protein